MAERAPDVAVLLVNFRQAERTLRCVRELLAAITTPAAVLLLDNGSGDGSAAALRAGLQPLAPRGVELIELEHNLGFAGAVNRGVDWAQQRGIGHVLLLNNDATFAGDFLGPLLDVLRHDARAAAVGPTILRADGRVWAQGGEFAVAPNHVRLRGHGRAPAPTTLGPQAVPFLPGACLLLRTADVAAIGGLDDGYFMYWEDVDLCMRLVARGGRLVWLPWVRIGHDGGGSSGGPRSRLRKYFMARNELRFLRRHGGWRGWLALLLDVLTVPLLFVRPRDGWAKLCGLLAGLHGRPATAADVQRWLA